MRPPIIINDSPDPDRPGDLEVHLTLEAALVAREIYDVGDPHLSLWDADGQPLMMMRGTFKRIEPSGLLERLLQLVLGTGTREILEIIPVAGAEPEPERLHRLLSAYCEANLANSNRQGLGRIFAVATTSDLLEVIRQWQGQDRQAGSKGE